VSRDILGQGDWSSQGSTLVPRVLTGKRRGRKMRDEEGERRRGLGEQCRARDMEWIAWFGYLDA